MPAVSPLPVPGEIYKSYRWHTSHSGTAHRAQGATSGDGPACQSAMSISHGPGWELTQAVTRVDFYQIETEEPTLQFACD